MTLFARTRTALALAALLPLAACSSSVTPGDAAMEASADARADALTDAGPDATYLDPDYAHALERMCVLEFTCDNPVVGGDFGPNLGTCARVMDDWLHLPAQDLETRATFDCALRSTDCASFRQCYSRGYTQAFCDTHATAACDGDVLVNCYSNAIIAVDCTTAGLHCQTVNGYGVCTNGVPCTLNADRCDGTVRVACRAPTAVESPLDCTQLGPGPVRCTTYESPGYTSAVCEQAPPPCTGAEPFCDQGVAVNCDPMTQTQQRGDCRFFTGTCAVDPGGEATCGGVAGVECSVYDFVDRCEGNAIVTCLGGRLERFDCTTAGLRTCATVLPDDAGTDADAGAPRAGCVP